MSSPIIIQGYLTASKLADALRQVVGAGNWLGGELTLPGSRKRWDMGFRREQSVIVVEYDGDEHYCNTLKIKVDREKDALAAKQGWRTVRFPYWVQLDTQTLLHYFGLSAAVETSFAHGFITTKWFPASFCEMGIDRFEQELEALPSTIRQAVLQSLQDRTAEHGVEFVLPTKLHRLLADLNGRPALA